MGKKKRKILFVFLLLLVFFSMIFLLIIYSSDKLLYGIPQQIQDIIPQFPVMGVTVDISNSIFRMIDELNIFRINKNLLTGTLPVYDLKLSRRDVEFFNNVSKISTEKGYLSPSINRWRQAELYFKGKNYDIKMKFHGDSPVHWSNNLKSYKIKIEKGSINNMQRFNLMIFEDRLLTGKITKMIANDFDLFNVRDDIVVLKINGVLQGLYYLQESLNTDFFENNQCSNCILIRTTDNWIEDHPRPPNVNFRDVHGISDGITHGTDFDDEISNINIEKNSINSKVLGSVNDLFEALKNNDINKVSEFFDIDQISSLESLRLLIGNNHFIHGDDLRMAYSLSTGKFYPIVINEDIEKLRLENGGVEHALNDDVPIFRLLVQNEQIRHMRNKKIYNYILDNNNLSDRIDELAKKILPYALSYKTNEFSRRYIKYMFKKHREPIATNFNIIKKNLEYSKCYLNIFEKNNRIRIEVIPDSIAQIKFDQLKINLNDEYSGKITFIYKDEDNIIITKTNVIENNNLIDLTSLTNGLYFSAGLDEEMYPAKRIYTLEITFNDAKIIKLNSIEIKMKNDITEQSIKQEDIYFQIVDENDYYPDKYLSFNEFKEKHPGFDWNYKNNELTLVKGVYTLNKDLIIPKFSKFNIEDGTIISIAENKSILSYSPVNIHGSELSPVVIKAIDKPFGTFGILGDKNQKTIINWLDLSGGSEKIINGIYFLGGLSIHNMNVELTNSKIHNNYADDGLNIKYANVIINNNKFHDNFADQFDCDFCIGIIKNSKFKNSKSEEGDGLDFSGSKVIVFNNEFEALKDKGISIGEETDAIVYNNNLINNNISIEVKDSSNVFIIKNTFKDNNIALNSYRKKLIFNGGNSYLYDNKYTSNNKKYTKDKESKMYNINFRNNDYNNLIEDIEKDNLEDSFKIIESYYASSKG